MFFVRAPHICGARRMRRFASLPVFLAVAACDDATRVAAPMQAAIPPSFQGASESSSARRWSQLSDSALFHTIANRGSVAVVGLRSTYDERGVVRGRVVLSSLQWRNAIAAVMSLEGIEVLNVDSTHLPVVKLRMRDVEALSRLRKLTTVEYVEPELIKPLYASTCGSSDADYADELISISSPSGTDHVSWKFRAMNIDRAWRYSTGNEVTVGITDTGLDLLDAASDVGPNHFATGQSVGRSFAQETLFDDFVTCSHGTRIAGVAVAPLNGRSVVGAAYKSNLYSVFQDDGVWPNTSRAAQAIHLAATTGLAKVIVMAWAEVNWYDNISNEIDAHFYQDDVVFVGAAGTCPWDSDSCPSPSSPMFPASKGEVLAVTGAAGDGSRPDKMYDVGDKWAAVTAYTDLATTGLGTTTIKNISGSSGATGVVGGIAALVRSRYPSESASWVMTRLRTTSGINCSAPVAWRNLMVHAFAAVGGFCPSRIMGATLAEFYSDDPDGRWETYSVSVSGGVGPYAVRWMTGETSTSIQQWFHPSQDGELRHIWVELQDLGSVDPAIRNEVYVRVLDLTGDEDCTPVPPAITC